MLLLCHSTWHDRLARTLFESYKGSRTSGFPSMWWCHWWNPYTDNCYQGQTERLLQQGRVVFYGNAVVRSPLSVLWHRMWMARQGTRRSCFKELKYLRRWWSRKAVPGQTGAYWHGWCQHLPDRRSSCWEYCLLVWIMKAYLVAVVTLPAWQHFNYRLSRVRMCIENAFGCLKGRNIQMLININIHDKVHIQPGCLTQEYLDVCAHTMSPDSSFTELHDRLLAGGAAPVNHYYLGLSRTRSSERKSSYQRILTSSSNCRLATAIECIYWEVIAISPIKEYICVKLLCAIPACFVVANEPWPAPESLLYHDPSTVATKPVQRHLPTNKWSDQMGQPTSYKKQTTEYSGNRPDLTSRSMHCSKPFTNRHQYVPKS